MAGASEEASLPPRVGIFWVYRGEIFGVAFDLVDAVTTSLGIVDADIDHASFWEDAHSFRRRCPELSITLPIWLEAGEPVLQEAFVAGA